jgi:hypothetical protein
MLNKALERRPLNATGVRQNEWPMIREFFERRRLRKAVAKFIPLPILDAILDQRESPADKRFEQRWIEVVLVMIRGDSVGIVSDRMARVAHLAAEHNGMVDCMVSALIVVVFGVLPLKHAAPGDARRTMAKLLAEFADNVKVVYTGGAANVGSFGNEFRAAYTFLLPGFCTALSTLCTLPFGQSREVRS